MFFLNSSSKSFCCEDIKDDIVATQIRALYDSGNFSLAEAGRILNPDCEEELVSPDGKDLFLFGDDGSVKFDLIRVDFDHLTQKWQDANFDAAMFALCLVQDCIWHQVPFTFENFGGNIQVFDLENTFEIIITFFPLQKSS